MKKLTVNFYQKSLEKRKDHPAQNGSSNLAKQVMKEIQLLQIQRILEKQEIFLNTLVLITHRVPCVLSPKVIAIPMRVSFSTKKYLPIKLQIHLSLTDYQLHLLKEKVLQRNNPNNLGIILILTLIQTFQQITIHSCMKKIYQ